MTAESSTERIPELTLGWRLRQAMEVAHVEAGQLARELNITRGTLSRWLHDKNTRPINPLFLERIAARCGVSYEWLINGPTRPTAVPGGDAAKVRDLSPAANWALTGQAA